MLQWILWIQSFNHPVLDQLFIIITMLGEELFYIFILSGIYWCVNKAMARQLVFVLTLSSVMNGALKEWFNTPRPFEIHEIRALRTETAHGASFPSGHTQTVASFFGALAILYKKWKLWVMALILTGLVGVSRLYLGLHWPVDVLGGAGLAVLAVIMMQLFFSQAPKKRQIMMIGLGSCLLLLFFKTETFLKGHAVFTGFLMGWILESQFINFKTSNRIAVQISKFTLGLALTGVVFIAMKWGFPDQFIFTWMRYFLILVFVTAVMPWLFIKLKWSEEVSVETK